MPTNQIYLTVQVFKFCHFLFDVRNIETDFHYLALNAPAGGPGKSLARPSSRCILFDGENISVEVSLVLYIFIYIYIYSINIPPITITNRIYETQNLLSL
jgi:hypothetical protein